MRAVHIWWSSTRGRITFSASAVGCTARANACTDLDRAWMTSVSCVLRIQRARYERRRQAERLTRLKCIEVYHGLKWIVRGKATLLVGICEKSLRSLAQQPTFGDRTPLALPPPLLRTRLPASAAASRAPSLACLTRAGRSNSCSLKCSTRSACRVHLPPQHSNIESAGTRDGYQYGCAIAFGSRTTDAPRSTCGRSHAKVIFEHAVVRASLPAAGGCGTVRLTAPYRGCWLRARRRARSERVSQARRLESRAAARGRRSQEDERASPSP